MLRHLTIKHYALIEHLDISFGDGLNILTGETGSGKSIILGALGLLLGERSDTKAVQEGKTKCVVEGVFGTQGINLADLLRAHDLDLEEPTTIRREVLSSGKSRAFVNDTPVNIKVLKEIGMLLVDIHSQHHTLQINDPYYQLRILDSYAQTGGAFDEYNAAYAKYREAHKAHSNALTTADALQRDLDYFAFQLKELEALRLDAIDAEELSESLNMLRNADEIAMGFATALQALTESEDSSLTQLHKALDAMAGLGHLSKTYEELHGRLKSVSIELLDISREVEALSGNVEADPRRLEQLESLQSSVYRMEQKHAVQGLAALVGIRDGLRDKIESASSAEEQIEILKEAVVRSLKDLKGRASALSKTREKGIKGLCIKVVEVLQSLNMPHASLDIRLHPLAEPAPMGMDQVEFMFSANAGQRAAALRDVASGGELSRLMLAIKNTASDQEGRGTIVFDEIDTGVSGEVAHSMGRIMRQMTQTKQVLSITHLPQVAAKGERHFKVFKEIVDGQTFTRIVELNDSERVQEIAQMLSGVRTTDAAIANAMELLGQE